MENFQKKSRQPATDLLEKLSVGDARPRKNSTHQQNGKGSHAPPTPRGNFDAYFPDYKFSTMTVLPIFTGAVAQYESVEYTYPVV